MRRLSSEKEDRVLLKFLVEQSQSLKHWKNVCMKCIQIYLLFLRMMVLEQLPRGNVNIVIVRSSRSEVFLKLASAVFYQIFIFSPNDSPLTIMKNVFYFI